jgi:hypothetical protein
MRRILPPLEAVAEQEFARRGKGRLSISLERELAHGKAPSRDEGLFPLWLLHVMERKAGEAARDFFALLIEDRGRGGHPADVWTVERLRSDLPQ